MKEQRKHPRFLVHWKIALSPDGGNGRVFDGVAYEISVGGASIYSDHNLFVKTPVTAQLTIPPLRAGIAASVLEIQCHMIYTLLSGEKGFRIGLHFDHFREGERQLLVDHLNHRFMGKQQETE